MATIVLLTGLWKEFTGGGAANLPPTEIGSEPLLRCTGTTVNPYKLFMDQPHLCTALEFC